MTRMAKSPEFAACGKSGSAAIGASMSPIARTKTPKV